MVAVHTWPGTTNLAYGFCSRAGGVSTGPFAALNLSFAVGDHDESVRRNWQLLAAALAPGVRFARVRQVHGNTVRVATAAALDLGDADALISASPGIAVAVLTADCVPILLSAARGRVVAAVHAGWRGTAQDVVGATVRVLETEFGIAPDAIEAALGPAIGGCCYDVGAEVVDALSAQPRLRLAREFVDSAGVGTARVDLRSANAQLLRAAGVPDGAIRSEGPCTRCAADEFFSHRAAAGGATGRQISYIVARAA